MPRPLTATVVEAYDNSTFNNLEMWVLMNTTTVHFSFPKWRANLDNKKLNYGYSKLQVHPGDLDNRTVVDVVAAADKLALAGCFAHALDTWNFYGVGIGGHDGSNPPMALPSLSHIVGFVRNVLWEGVYTIPSIEPSKIQWVVETI